MCEGDAFGELVRINRKFGSLGLNFKCEGLLLGMWSMGHKETPPLRNSTSHDGPLLAS
jgi:hypothetical protein